MRARRIAETLKISRPIIATQGNLLQSYRRQAPCFLNSANAEQLRKKAKDRFSLRFGFLGRHLRKTNTPCVANLAGQIFSASPSVQAETDAVTCLNRQ